MMVMMTRNAAVVGKWTPQCMAKAAAVHYLNLCRGGRQAFTGERATWAVKFHPSGFWFAGVISEKVISYDRNICLRHIIMSYCNSIFRYCSVLWLFVGLQLHRLNIVRVFVFIWIFQFPQDYIYWGVKNIMMITKIMMIIILKAIVCMQMRSD